MYTCTRCLLYSFVPGREFELYTCTRCLLYTCSFVPGMEFELYTCTRCLLYSFVPGREFELRLPRDEVEEVDLLRDHWQELLALAEEVRQVLLKEKRGNFEQELDKQIKVMFDGRVPITSGKQGKQ